MKFTEAFEQALYGALIKSERRENWLKLNDEGKLVYAADVQLDPAVDKEEMLKDDWQVKIEPKFKRGDILKRKRSAFIDNEGINDLPAKDLVLVIAGVKDNSYLIADSDFSKTTGYSRILDLIKNVEQYFEKIGEFDEELL